MAIFLFLGVSTIISLIVLALHEDPEWQISRHITRLAKASLERERHPKQKRGYSHVCAGYFVKRR